MHDSQSLNETFGCRDAIILFHAFFSKASVQQKVVHRIKQGKEAGFLCLYQAAA